MRGAPDFVDKRGGVNEPVFRNQWLWDSLVDI